MSESYDWSKFEIFMYVQGDLEKIYDKWATSSGLKAFFIREATFTNANGRVKSKDIRFEADDSYEWLWWHNDYRSKGKILRANAPKTISFSFGSSEVQLDFSNTRHGVQIRLVQTKIQVSETEKVHTHLDCRSGWIYFLCNLKANVEHGIDIRQKNPATEGCVSVRFQGPSN
jgi:hypothetical protein